MRSRLARGLESGTKKFPKAYGLFKLVCLKTYNLIWQKKGLLFTIWSNGLQFCQNRAEDFANAMKKREDTMKNGEDTKEIVPWSDLNS